MSDKERQQAPLPKRPTIWYKTILIVRPKARSEDDKEDKETATTVELSDNEEEHMGYHPTSWLIINHHSPPLWPRLQ